MRSDDKMSVSNDKKHSVLFHDTKVPLLQRTEMAALPEQAVNEPLLNNSTEQHTDNLASGALQPSQTDLRSSEEKPNDALQPLFHDDRSWSRIKIIGGVVVAVVLALGHHTLLLRLNGQNIDDFSQVWIKGANNGFSNLFSIFVGLSAGSALTQIKWRASGFKPLPMDRIDILFALPEPLELLKALIHLQGPLLVPILSSIFIQALVLVSILAPSALTIAPSEQVQRDIVVPIFNMTSHGAFYDMIWEILPSGLLAVDAISLTPEAEQRMNSVLLNLPEIYWAIPQGCGLKCTFSFEYEAPGLECHDVILSDVDVPFPYPKDFYMYQASTTLYPPWNKATSPSWQFSAPYDLSINYTDMPFPYNASIYPRTGTYCRFRKAHYNASFELNSSSSTQLARTSIISYGDYLSVQDGVTPRNFTGYLGIGLTHWAICYTFALAFRGNMTPLEFAFIEATQPALVSIFNGSPPRLLVSNLSQALGDLFSNLTLGILSIRRDNYTTTANASIWDGSSVWIYATWILWGAYLPTLILAITVALYGLYTIHLSGIAMDNKFSTLLLATRNADLDKMCGEAADFEELERIELIHQKKGTFLVVDS